jgi:hypothetical protein
MSNSSRTNGFARTAIVLSSFVVVAHAGLIPIGHWQPDEYLQLAMFRESSFASTVGELLQWTPRPVHVLLVGLYASIVERSGMPLVGPTLALAWTAALAGIYVSARTSRRNPLACAMGVLAMLLLVGRPGEVFYWPVGVSAYLPTVVGLTCASLLLLRDRLLPRHAVGLALSLTVAAASSEMGAAFVLLYAIFHQLVSTLDRDGTDRLSSWAWLVPGMLALVEIVIFASHRAATGSEVMQSEATTLAAVWPSLQAALPTFLWETAALPMLPGNTTDLLLGLPLKLALFLGLRPGPGSPAIPARRRNEAWVRACALLATCFLSLFFAYSQFGLVCCPRHGATRQIMIFLAIASIASVCPTRRPAWIATSRGRAALLLLPLAVLTARRSGQLLHDYKVYSEAREARASTWSSGHDPRSSFMRYVNGPRTKVINYWRLEPGIYRLDDRQSPTSSEAWHSRAVLRFFEKSELRVDPDPSLPAARKDSVED